MISYPIAGVKNGRNFHVNGESSKKFRKICPVGRPDFIVIAKTAKKVHQSVPQINKDNTDRSYSQFLKYIYL